MSIVQELIINKFEDIVEKWPSYDIGSIVCVKDAKSQLLEEAQVQLIIDTFENDPEIGIVYTDCVINSGDTYYYKHSDASNIPNISFFIRKLSEVQFQRVQMDVNNMMAGTMNYFMRSGYKLEHIGDAYFRYSV